MTRRQSSVQPPQESGHECKPGEDRRQPEQESPPRGRELPALAPVALQADRPDPDSALGQRRAVAAHGVVAGGTRTGRLRAAVDAARTGVVVHALEAACHAGRVARKVLDGGRVAVVASPPGRRESHAPSVVEILGELRRVLRGLPSRASLLLAGPLTGPAGVGPMAKANVLRRTRSRVARTGVAGGPRRDPRLSHPLRSSVRGAS